MELWKEWWKWAKELRPACSRERTWLWLLVVLMGFSVRNDLLGVSSIVRGLGLQDYCYDRLLDFFHSPALSVDKLRKIWTALVFRMHPGIVRIHGMAVLLCDGVKIAKSGRKMPGVKRLFQSSDSNTKPEYISGHSCQELGVLVQNDDHFATLPLGAEISEGVVFSNRDRRTLLDKVVQFIFSIGIPEPFVLLADAYYASRKLILPLLKLGCVLISRVKNSAVAYEQANQAKLRKCGRPALYGKKITLRFLFADLAAFTEAISPVYGEKGLMLRYRVADLMWRPVGIKVRFVLVIHPTRGRCILMCSDLRFSALEIIALYGLRFKIEVSFKQAIHTVGAYLYHFWMRMMSPRKRNGGNQHVHRKSDQYRIALRRKMDAYHRFIQIGLIAQGLMVVLATIKPQCVWRSFGSYLRTYRQISCPSEFVVSIALKNSYSEFLVNKIFAQTLLKFLLEKIDWSRRHSHDQAA